MQTVQQTSEARVHIQDGFAWDGQDAYLFDIDGTLLRSRDRIHVDSFVTTVKQVTGIEVSLAGVALAGSTDTAILREACAKSGIAPEVLEPQVSAILQGMCANVAGRRGEFDLVLMPGVKEALRHLASRGALLGVGTGNLEMIGWIKIEEAGLREWFRFGGFSDHHPVRSELIGAAARKAREMAGRDVSVCVVGDTPRDIEAAHDNGLPVIAVATGHFSFDVLLELKPEGCASSLSALMSAGATQDAP